MSFSAGAKGFGLGMGDVEQLMRPLSFGFQTPQRQRIRRKPLNWDAARLGAEDIPAIGMAVPLGDEGHRRSGSDGSDDISNARYEDTREDPEEPHAL